jgi:precorrin-6Y C5,15-methyltransferase (decarboxylating)
VSTPIIVQGIGADGWDGLPETARQRIRDAEVLLGGERHLELLPPVEGQVREPWPSPLREGLPALLWKYDGRRVVALASGDPMRSGVGTTLIQLLGRDAVAIEPAVSSVALARARMGWSAEQTSVVTIVGRDARTVLRQLAPGHRVLVLTSDGTTPGEVAALLTSAGYGATRMTVLADLGAATERTSVTTAAAWTGEAPELHVLALHLDGPAVGAWTGGLPDAAYEHDGQLTKRDVRATALAHLAPQPGQLLWDVGAGAGSVGIEWMRAHTTCRAVAIEKDEERAGRVARNAGTLGVPGLRVVTGTAPDVLHDLQAPDAIFVGGGATADGLLDLCRERLRPGGRLVVHGVTLETEQLLGAAYTQHGGVLTRISVEHAEPIGTFTGWTPARAVTQWTWTRAGGAA